jgi:hypothetical protein
MKFKLSKKRFRMFIVASNLLTITMIGAILAVTSCQSRPKEHYSSLASNYCSKTEVTCFKGDGSVLYHNVVCRYYFNYGELSIAQEASDTVSNVVLTRNESCVFNKV